MDTSSQNDKQIPVIPPGHWFFRNSLEVLKDPLAFFSKTFTEYGDFYDVNANFFTIYIVANPDYIQEIMVTNKTDYGKSDDYKVLKNSLGNGLLTSEGEFWKKQRRIAQPAFHRNSIKMLLSTMVSSTQVSVEKMKSLKQVDILEEMNFLALDIVTKALLGTTIDTDLKKIQESIAIGNKYLSKKIMKPLSLPIWLPTPESIRYKKSRKFSRDIVLDIINNRKNDPTEHHDLLSMLMNAKDEETGEKMSTQQLRDETITMFVAGHETTSNALAWTFYLLSLHPDKMQTLQEEIDTVLKGEAPTFEDLKELKYTEMVISEGLRMYPPAWSMGRQVVNDTVMHGYKLKKNTKLIIDVHTLHHHPKHWENPAIFEPERFSPERKKQRHKYAYIPFGAGQRMCIGNNFAMMEMKVVLTMFLQNFKLSMAKDAPEVVPEAMVTLSPKNGILMDVKLR